MTTCEGPVPARTGPAENATARKPLAVECSDHEDTGKAHGKAAGGGRRDRPTPDRPNQAHPWEVVGYLTWLRVLRVARLPPSAGYVAHVLGGYSTADTGRSARPGLDELAAATGYSTRHIRDQLAHLRERGLVRRVRIGSDMGREKQADEYVLTVPYDLTMEQRKAAGLPLTTGTPVPVPARDHRNPSSADQGDHRNWGSATTGTGVPPTSSVPPQEERERPPDTEQRDPADALNQQQQPAATTPTSDHSARLLTLRTLDADVRDALRSGECRAVPVRDLAPEERPKIGHCPGCGARVRTGNADECWSCGHQVDEAGDVLALVDAVDVVDLTPLSDVDRETVADALLTEHAERTGPIPGPVRAATRRQVVAVLRDGCAQVDVRAGLDRMRTAGLGLRLLPELVAEAQGRRTSGHRRKERPSWDW